jgi:hypothetical protein
MLSVVIISGCSLETGPADKTYTDISLAEAQRLVPFTLCLPSYLPDELTSTPKVVYHAEMGDPKDADVRLRYYRPNETTPVVEVFQKASSIDLERYNTSEYGGRHVAESELVRWAIGLSGTQEVKSGITVSVTKYVDDLISRWVYEIPASEPARANMIEWGNGHKYYQVYTHFPLDEAQRIAQSMKDCEMVPTVVPISK